MVVFVNTANTTTTVPPGVSETMFTPRINDGPAGETVAFRLTVPAKLPTLVMLRRSLPDDPCVSCNELGLAVNVKSGETGLVTVREPKALWTTEPLIPATVKLYMPTAADAFVKILITEPAIPSGLRNTTVGETENVTPGGADGSMFPDRETDPLNPERLVTVILMEPAEFCGRVRMVGLTLILKSGLVLGDMIRCKRATWVSEPLAPDIVRV